MNGRRKCIFTGEEANYLLQMGEDNHNWAKRVPCTREWWESNRHRPLTPKEFKLVELFFEQELARLKIDNLEAEIQRIRDGRVTIVSAEEWDKLQDYLANPPEPTPALVEAMKKYKEKISPAEELTNNFKAAAEELGIAEKLYNKELVLEVNGETIKEAQKVAYEYEPTIIDEPEDLDVEAVEKLMKEPPLKPTKGEIVKLSSPKKNDKIEKKVVKKKPVLWD